MSGSSRDILAVEVDVSAGAAKVSIVISEYKDVRLDASFSYHLHVVLACKVDSTFDAKVMLLNIMFLKLRLRLAVNIAIWAIMMRLD